MRSHEIIRENYKLGKNKTLSRCSRWMKIGRCISGHGFIESGERTYPYSSGDYFVMLSNITYIVESESECDTIWESVLIDEKEVGSLFCSQNKVLFEKMFREKENRIQVFDYLDKPKMGLAVRLLFGEIENGGIMQHENLAGIVQILFVYIIRDFQENDVNCEKDRKDGFDYILPSVQYIMDHYKETIRISTLAKVCYVSESYFRKVFCEYMHVSPAEYINQFRIDKACELIKNTDYPIDMIASEVGFKSMATFYRNFKQYKGCKPFELKSNHS